MYEQIKVSKCKQCGKDFVKAPQTVFGDFCSWRCKCAAERERDELRKIRGEITRRKNDERKKKAKDKKLQRKGACKPCLQYTKDGEFVARYESVRDAAEAVGLSATCISECLRGHMRYAKGFVWKYGEKKGKAQDDDSHTI